MASNDIRAILPPNFVRDVLKKTVCMLIGTMIDIAVEENDLRLYLICCGLGKRDAKRIARDTLDEACK